MNKRPPKPKGRPFIRRPAGDSAAHDRPRREGFDRDARRDRPDSRPHGRSNPPGDRFPERARPDRYRREQPFEHRERRPFSPRPESKPEGQVWRREVKPAAAEVRPEAELTKAALATNGPGGYQKFQEIPAHRLGRALRGRLYEVANHLPEEENLNLRTRIKYAATSVTATLASGFGEGVFRSCLTKSLESRGALTTLLDHLEHLGDQKFLGPEEALSLRTEVESVLQAVNDFLGKIVKEHEGEATH